MDNDEAKFVLRAYRSNGADAGLPAFSEAIEQARRDPALSKWFEAEQAFDRAVSAKLRSLSPPAGLRESILAGGRASKHSSQRWATRSWLAIAASVLIVVGISAGWPMVQHRAEAAQISQSAMDDTLHGHHGNQGEATHRLETYLENDSVRLAQANLPVSLSELRSTGCRSLSFGGREVVELCFFRHGKDFHLYVMSKLPGAPREPKIIQQDGAASAQWTNGNQSYVLATAAGVSALEKLL